MSDFDSTVPSHTDKSLSGASKDTRVASTVETGPEKRPSLLEGTTADAVHNLTALETPALGREEISCVSVTVNPRSSVPDRECPEQEAQESQEKESVREPLLSGQSDHEVADEVTAGVIYGADAGTCTLQNRELEKKELTQGQNGGDSWCSDPQAEECPICTERYDSSDERRKALLNCDHTVCLRCLADMLKRAADASRVCCPLCRQKTPLPDWEIRRMQEEAVYHMGSATLSLPPPHTPLRPSSSQPAPGLCAALERRLESRIADTAMVCGCFRYPPRVVQGIRQLRHRCRCCYLTGLLLLYLAELSCLLLVFLPVIVLVLLFTLANK